MGWRLVAGVWVALTGCGPAAPEQGTPRSSGVAQAWFEARANGTDLVRVQVVFPADDAGRPSGRQHRGLVFVHGGLVSLERYLWLAQRLAERGVVVALPRHPLDLAIAAIENGRAARALLREGPGLLEGLVDGERVAVAGHSLGAVVAGKLMLGGGFSKVAYLAGYPESADVGPLNAVRAPSLAIAGAADCDATLPEVLEALSRLSPPAQRVVLDGVTHYQFTDSDAQDVKAGCLPGAALETAHDDIAAALAGFLEAGR